MIFSSRFISFAVVVLALAGCGGGGEGEATTAAAKASALVDVTADGTKKTVANASDANPLYATTPSGITYSLPAWRTICGQLAKLAVPPSGISSEICLDIANRDGAVAGAGAAAFVNLTATPNLLTAGTPNVIRVVAELSAAPGGKVELLLETNGVSTVLGTMVDDGSGGDEVSGDRRFTLVTSLQAAKGDAVNLRARTVIAGTQQTLNSSILALQVANALDLAVTAGQGTVTLLAGQSVTTTFLLNVSNQPGATVKVTATQAVAPANSGLVVVASDLAPAGYTTTSAQQTFLVQTRFTANTEGTFTVRLQGNLTAPSGTRQAEATMIVKVLPASGIGELALSVNPGGLSEGATGPIQAGARYAGGQTLPQSVRLEQVSEDGTPVAVLGAMRDDGVAPDLGANDLNYSARPTFNGGVAGTRRYLRAVATFANGASRASPIVPLETFPFPVGFKPVDMALAIADPEGGRVMCNQLLVRFKPGTTIVTVRSVATGIGATVQAVEPSLNTYQLVFACTTIEGLAAKITALAGQPSVAGMSPNGISEVEGMIPNDTLYARQYAPQLTRADEAWIIARGKGQVVAVLDSGVWAGHPDLVGRVDNGKDWVNDDDNPDDDHSHGTHVAGIVAAAGNNARGIAGVAWETRIYAIKVCGGDSRITFSLPGLPFTGGCPDSAIISGIVEATAKAGVINISLSGPRPSLDTLTSALGFPSIYEIATVASRASGAVVVAASGNANTGKQHAPCAFDGVLCVGNTTSSDLRYADAKFGSNFGPHVDIAAPGTGIVSTVPLFTSATGYALKTGTSMASPFVAGVAALVRGVNPTWNPDQVEERLIKTAVPLPGQQVGPRVDAFDAVFNGSFEHDLSGWSSTGTVSAIDRLGPLSPTKDKKMAMASTGPDGVITTSDLSQSFVIQPGITQIKLSFDYALISEEFPEYIGRGFNDDLVFSLVGPTGAEILAIETVTVDGSTFVGVTGFDFPGGDSTVGWTGWRRVLSRTIPVAPGGGTYRIRVRDRGDGIFDTNAIIDNIRFR